MADQGPFSDDISALWGPQQEGPLEPPQPGTAAWHPEPAQTNGNHATMVEEPSHNGVAALADALAAHQVDSISKVELATVRADLEGAFTHQLAVALYELLGASNDRVALAEDHIDKRLNAIADRLAETIEAQARRLTASIDVHQRESAKDAEGVRSELAAAGEQLAVIRDEQSVPVEKLGDVSERITSLQNDVATLREAVTELRQAVDGRRRKGIGSWWSRTD